MMWADDQALTLAIFRCIRPWNASNRGRHVVSIKLYPLITKVENKQLFKHFFSGSRLWIKHQIVACLIDLFFLTFWESFHFTLDWLFPQFDLYFWLFKAFLGIWIILTEREKWITSDKFSLSRKSFLDYLSLLFFLGASRGSFALIVPILYFVSPFFLS